MAQQQEVSVVLGDERVKLGRVSAVVHRAAKAPAHALVVVLHGLGDHAHYQDEVIRACLRHPRTAALALDFPGHGESEGPRGHVDEWSDYEDAVVDCLAYGEATFPLAEVVLYGNSMGGLVAIDVGLRRGQSIASVLASAPMVALPVNAVVKEALKGIGWIAPTKTVDIDPKAEPPRHGVCTLGWLRHAASACDRLKKEQLLLGDDEDDDDDAVKPPITLFIGDKDPIVSQSDVRELADRLHCDAIMVYNGSGHEPFANDRFGRPDKNKRKYINDVAMLVTDVATTKAAVLANERPDDDDDDDDERKKSRHSRRLGPKLLPRW